MVTTLWYVFFRTLDGTNLKETDSVTIITLQYLFLTSGNDSTSRKINSEKVKSDSSSSINDEENDSNKEYKTYSFLQQVNKKLKVFCENLLSRLHKVQHNVSVFLNKSSIKTQDDDDEFEKVWLHNSKGEALKLYSFRKKDKLR